MFMKKQHWCVPIRPLEELRHELFSGCENRQKNLEELSKQYVKQYTKCLNEIFNTHYRKTVMDSRTKKKSDSSFYIIVYSKFPLSNEEVYAISSSYQHESQFEPCLTELNFLSYLTWCYHEFDDIKNIRNRIRLYDYVDDYLLIVLDVKPEELGFDSTIIKTTKFFNVKEESGKYQTLIKAYNNFDILVSSENPLVIKEVISIAKSHRAAQGCICYGEENATYSEFLSNLKNTGFSRKIKSYEYHNGFLAIEIK